MNEIMRDAGADEGQAWPAVGNETLPWRQLNRRGTREDRMFDSVNATVPPFIAHLDYRLNGEQSRASEQALLAIARMDAEAAATSVEITRFMIRTESVASSKIERVAAGSEDLARAIAGSKANDSARSMVAASVAISRLVESAGLSGRIELPALLDAHRALMADDPLEGPHAGTIRHDQNWIGGSDASPRGAVHVPPGAHRVEVLLDDLLEFSNRDDLPVLAQVAIAHAQFETIHPFGDGNGRLGRALIGAILRRRGMTENSIVPLASGLNARRDLYFESLNAYRSGRVAPLLALMCRAAEVGSTEGRVSVERILAFPGEWVSRVQARADSAAAKLIPAFFSNPVMSASEVESLVPASTPQIYNAIQRLEEADVIHEITGRQRDKVWVATDVLDELDDLDLRIRNAFDDADSKGIALARFEAILGHPYPLGVGSSVPSRLFTDAARYAAVSDAGSMPERARRIVEAAGLEWTSAHDSTTSASKGGSTVTLAGLNRLLDALMLLGAH
jgi:Fic family protein